MEMGEMKREGFTLVELLVVIAILGILLAMMVPAAGVIMKKAKNSQAQADLGVVQGALMKYRMEYNRWPDVKAVHGGYAGTSERWVEIMNPDVTTGSGKRDADNFRQLRFLEIGKGMVADSGRYKGAFCDPWTHSSGRVPYLYAVDDDGDGKVDPPDGSDEVQAQVLVWSAGADGDWDTWEDNVASWEKK